MSTLLPLRSTLAVALAMAALPAMAGQFGNTVVFGDSLSDSGHFQIMLPPEVRPATGRFTTNPAWVWAEYVANHYGGDGRTDNQGGDNYAQGGSRVTVQNGAAESTVSQMQRYLGSAGGKADPRTLYTVWTGANDIFAIAGAGAPAQQTIATAVGGVTSYGITNGEPTPPMRSPALGWVDRKPGPLPPPACAIFCHRLTAARGS